MKKILAIGNALTDVLTCLESDDLLEKFALPKGSMQLIDEKKLAEIQAEIRGNSTQLVSGGSSANTVRGLANLGAETGFIGKVGDDEIGVFFVQEMKNLGVNALISNDELPSGRCLALISPDGERTFCTFLGAAANLQILDIENTDFQDFEIFHIEGYLIQNQQLIETAVKKAKNFGLTVSLDLASFNVVENNRDFLRNLIKNYVDIVFANEDEALALTGKSPQIAAEEIAKICEIAVVKIGKKGSIIATKNEFFQIAADEKIKAVDTTGAGDLYAAGFLYGLATGENLRRCGEIGAKVAEEVVQIVGSSIDENGWQKIRNFIK